MKKVIILILLLLLPSNVYADNRVIGEYGTYENARKIIKETMRAYYIRGPHLQYNYSKAVYGGVSPEEATSQDIQYNVCAAYTYGVYNEAFGSRYLEDVETFPRYNYDISNVARAYYDAENPRDGTYLIWYANTTDNINYIYNDAYNFSDFVNLIHPGDLFVFSGHALIAYDVATNPNTNKKDVLILNSTGHSKNASRIGSETSYLYYDELGRVANNTLEIASEGAVKWRWLSDITQFVDSKTGKMSCTKEECAVVRVFYKGANDEAIFNYSIDPVKYKNSLFRTIYRGIYVEKTVNINDNNSVYLGDELTYTIKITNMSSSTSATSYNNKFYIEETIGDMVEYLSSTQNGTYADNHITWAIDNLDAGKSISLKYTVRIKNDITNINKMIAAIGKVYSDNNDIGYITTGTVSNKIVGKSFNTTETYQNCYTANASKKGLEMINSVYQCATGIDFNFTNFNFDAIFTKKENKTSKATNNTLLFNSNINFPNDVFAKMILNHYYAGLVQYKINGETLLHLPRWSLLDSYPRAKTINAMDFQDGDVLIYYVDTSKTYDNTISNNKYTDESGIYAYIYINGKFQGKNGTGATQRNDFTYDYYGDEINQKLYIKYKNDDVLVTEDDYEFFNYQSLFDKDYYIILRPSLLIKDITFNTNKYNISTNHKIIYGITSGTSVDELLNNTVTSGSSIVIGKNNETVFPSSLLKTGYIVKTIFGAESDSPLIYKVSIKGDTLGTGVASIKSAKNIAHHIIDGNIITGNEYLYAADYDNNDKIKMNDVVKLLKENN